MSEDQASRIGTWGLALFVGALLWFWGLSCGTPSKDPWFERLLKVPAEASGEAEMISRRYLELAAEATSPEQRCQATILAARETGKYDKKEADRIFLRLSGDPECEQEVPEATLFLAVRAFEEERIQRAARLSVDVVSGHPETYWARVAVKTLWDHRHALEKNGISFPGLMEALYEETRETAVAGHLLYSASEWALGEDNDVDSALVYLVTLVDYHSHSALWDDAVWLAADILHDRQRFGDETEILEEVLRPHPGRGYDAQVDDYTQKVRGRLAGLYEKQGRYDEALHQLELVVNVHSTQSRKDDALWASARIYAMKGESEEEIRTLEYLIAHCPWSRHVDRAKQRVEERRRPD